MFQFLFIFGPAAVTCLLAQKCSQKSPLNWYMAVIEMICYGALDTLLTVIILAPLDKVKIIASPDGVNVIQYGSTAFVFSMIIGAVCGLLAAMLKKRVDIRIEIEENREDTKDVFRKS